jgi:predicted nucleic acid-binding Zn ribbon protein
MTGRVGLKYRSAAAIGQGKTKSGNCALLTEVRLSIISEVSAGKGEAPGKEDHQIFVSSDRLPMKLIRKTMDKPAPLGGILQKALQAANIDVDLNLHKLWERWTDLVGPVIAENARPAAIKGRLLLIHVSSAPWMQQLYYLKDELMEKLNSALGKESVKDIRFKIGPLD